MPHASEKDTAPRPDAQEAAGEPALPSATSGLVGADALQAAGLEAAAAACPQQPYATPQQQDVQREQQDGDGWAADVLQHGAAPSPPLPEDSGQQRKKRTRWLEFPPASLQFAMLLSENSVKLKSFHVPDAMTRLAFCLEGHESGSVCMVPSGGGPPSFWPFHTYTNANAYPSVKLKVPKELFRDLGVCAGDVLAVRNLGPRHAAFEIWRAGSPEAAAYLGFERTAPGGRLVAADEVAGAADEQSEASRLPRSRRWRRAGSTERQDANALQQLMLLIDAAELEEEQEAAEAAAAASIESNAAGAAAATPAIDPAAAFAAARVLSGQHTPAPLIKAEPCEEPSAAWRLQCALCSRWRQVSHACHLIFQGRTGCCADFVRPDCTTCSCEQPCDDCGQAVCMCTQLASAAQVLSAALQQQQQQPHLLPPAGWAHGQPEQSPLQLLPAQQHLAPLVEAGQRFMEMSEAVPARVAAIRKGRHSAEEAAADEQEAVDEAAGEAGARGTGRGRGGKRRKLAAKFTGVVEKGHNRFRAGLTYKSKTIWLGYFDSADKAAEARDKAVVQLRGADSKLNMPWPPETIQAWLQETPTGVVAAAIANADTVAAPAAEGQLEAEAEAAAAAPAVAPAAVLPTALSSAGTLPWAPAVWLPVVPMARRAALPAGLLRREARAAALQQLEAALDALFPAETGTCEADADAPPGDGAAEARQLLAPPPQVGDALRQLKRVAAEGAALASDLSPSPSASEHDGSIRWLVQ